MTRSRPLPTFNSAGARRVGAALALVILARSAPAAAQACCAGGALVSPARLALHEDYAVGVQLRARGALGSFDPAGHYASLRSTEQDLEQDFAASLRLGERLQAGVVLPTVETHRAAQGRSEWGGGVGDLAFNARYDFLLAGEALYWPGLGLLASAVLPTGTPPDQAKNPSATDATGTGTYNATVGLAVEKVAGHAYGAIDGWVTYRFTRTVSVPGLAPLTESFAPQWTVLAVAGYVFDSEAALALYVNFLAEGDGTVNGTRDPSSSLRLTTLGLAGVLPLRDRWRIQGAVFSDVLISWFGRNEPVAGVGATASLVRVWL
jgi:hypothetical protein